MANYIITCCSTADLSIKDLKEKNIPYVSFHYFINDNIYPDDFGQTMSLTTFYKQLKQGAEVKTSQVNVMEYENFFRPFLEQGLDILHLELSSGISGSFNSANIAKSMLEEEYPSNRLMIADTLCASSGYGMMVEAAWNQKCAGMSMDKLYQWIMEQRQHLQHLVFSTDLTYYIKGGRVSPAAGTIGNLLHVCPLLRVDKEGKLVIEEKVRTKKKAIWHIIAQMEQHAQNGTNYNGKCYLSMSDCYEDAKAVAAEIEKTFLNLDGPVKIYDIGTVIGCHTGPGTIAIFFWGDQRS